MMCFGLKDRKRLRTNHCVIVLLDDTQLVHELHPTSTGQDLLDVVIKHLNLLETSYFGLKYYLKHSNASAAAASASSSTNANNTYQYSAALACARYNERQPVWLDVEKSAIKQLKDIDPMTVYFGVKYYATDPCKLAEEITRYQFFLQCKQDILHARLPISFELAIELFGLAIQSELGDYDPQRHPDGYVSEFSFLPNQSVALEQRAAQFHRQHLIGQVPATAELNFLERVKWLDLYGCELHPIQYDDDDGGGVGGGGGGDYQYALGLNPTGVLVLRNKLKVAQYLWPRIVKTKCQGRCFLMDVIVTTSNNTGGDLQQLASGASKGATSANRRSRFGFRLADKEASRRLRWSIEEHKQFYYLIHSSATLNQLANRQQHQQQQQMQAQAQAQVAAAAAAAVAAAEQQIKFSQRFRNSIRSAINLGAHFNLSAAHHHPLAHHNSSQQMAAIQQQQQLQHHKFRSSIKSMLHQNNFNEHQQQQQQQQQQQHFSIDRQPPTVVRMPSRRYSNRSLPRPSGSSSTLKHNYQHQVAANDNGLPAAVGMASTMVDSQRQQAMLMMANQFNQQHPLLLQPPVPMGKSQTLKPISSKEAKQRNSSQYYQMMMLMMAAQQQQQSQKCPLPEVSILPPGQHIVQPSIYRASSVVDGINQLGGTQQQQQQALKQQHKPTMMQQFFNTRGQQQHQYQAGRESPRSTKSAMVSSSALKSASKKLAKQHHHQQQQLLFVAEASDVRPLLAYAADSTGNSMDANDLQVYSNTLGSNYYAPAGAYSAAASPRSARSCRLSSASKYRSKSTGENLHMLHQSAHVNNMVNYTGSNGNKLLLATAIPLDATRTLPPPDYESGGTPVPTMGQHRFNNQDLLVGCGGGAPSKSKLLLPPPPPAKMSINSKQIGYNSIGQHLQPISASRSRTRRNNAAKKMNAHNDHDDDNYCSRSDCSSTCNQDVTARANNQQQKQHQQVMRQQMSNEQARKMADESRHEWNAMRRRHDELVGAKDYPSQIEAAAAAAGVPHYANEEEDPNNNECSTGGHLAVKNMINKQATPILLSMHQFADHQTKMNPNNKAVQLLNLQRQQLNSQSSESSANRTNTVTSSGSDSVASSVASSPKALLDQAADKHKSFNGHRHHNAADSTASNSTATSGYYAGSNSTGPASVDSDTIGGESQPIGTGGGGTPINGHPPRQSTASYNSNNNKSGSKWTPNSAVYAEGTRAKIALGVHGSSPRVGSGAVSNRHQQQHQGSMSREKQQKFYLGEVNDNVDEQERQSVKLNQHQQHQWSQLEQMQQGNNAQSSLKYVSFDV